MSTVEETYEPRMFRPLAIACSVAGLLALTAGACDDGPSTAPDGARPERLEAVSPESASVDASAEAGSPLRVRVAGADGEPREGVEVRYLLTRGPGRVVPTTAATGPDGVAEVRYLPGGGTGRARIRADAPEAPWIAPVIFRRTARPDRVLRLSAAGGTDQRAESGSQLPRPLAVTARTSHGEPAPGVRVAFAVVASPGSAALSADTVLTGADGRASVLLTLAGRPGTHRVRAVPAGPAGGDTVRFGAEAVRELDSGLRLDSVRPTPVRAGETAILFGRGLESAAEVWLDGTSVSVDGSEAGRIRVRLPASDACRPRRRATLRVRAADGAWSDALETVAAPAEPSLDLGVGEVRTLAVPGPGGCVRLPAASGRTYRLTVASAARSGAARTPLALRIRAGIGGLAGRGAASGAPRSAASVDPRRGRGATPDRPDLEGRLRGSARSALRTPGVLPARRSGGGEVRADPAPSPADSRPRMSAGDTARLHFAVGPDLVTSCTDTADAITGVARAVGPGVSVVEDTAAPAGLTTEDFRLIRDEFERLVLPTATSYFGPPADIDGNGRVILLLTPRVNDLTPREAQSRIGGFFLPVDLADAGPGGGVSPGDGATCPASNEGEVLYLATADPSGAFGPPLDRTGALRNARSIGSHELEHLLSAEQRVIRSDGDFGDLQEVWLAEGMAHLAEEAVGHAATGAGPGSNLGFDYFAGSRERLEAFNVFHLQNFGRLQLFLRSPSLTPALSGVDPGGAAGLRMRGFAWLFSRWLGDRAGPGGEAGLFRRLSSGGPAHLTGVENVESATGGRWRDLLLEFLRVPLLDDRSLSGTDGPTAGGPGQLATWDLRALYEGLQANPSAGRLFPAGYPLAPTRVASSGLLSLDLPAGAPAYFSAGGSAPSPALAFGLTSADGGPPPASASLHVTVIRLR